MMTENSMLLLEVKEDMSGGYGTETTVVEISNFGMTVAACVLTCAVNTICSSIFYNAKTSSCRIMQGFYHSKTNWVMEPNWKYYLPYPPLQLTLYTKTGTVDWAATDASVYIRIKGSKGDTDQILLRYTVDGTMPFRVGKTDVFNIETVNFGEIRQVNLWQDGKGPYPGWFVDYIRITSSNPVIDAKFNIGGNVGINGYNASV